MKILIIDDDIALCTLIKNHLEKGDDECVCLYDLDNVSSTNKSLSNTLSAKYLS